MVFKWRDDRMEKFLELYRKHECLWNINSGLYKCKEARDTAYHTICVEMNIPELAVSDVKNKIKIIRTNYKVELNKILRSKRIGSGSSNKLYVPRLFWFKKADEFLRGVYQACDLNFQLLDSSSQQNNVTMHTHLKGDDLNSIEETRASSETTNNIVKRKDTTENKPRPKVGVKKRSHSMITVEKSINKLQKISELCKKDDDDEFDLFGKSIAIQLKKMPLDRALLCQEKMQSVMKQERLYQLNRGLSSHSIQNNIAQCSTADPFSSPTSPSWSEASRSS